MSKDEDFSSSTEPTDIVSKIALMNGQVIENGECLGTVDMPAEKAIRGAWSSNVKIDEKSFESVQEVIQIGIPQENLRYSSVPIPADKIREYFTNKDLFFIVNHSESKLQGETFLTYLTNLSLPADVKFNTPLPYEEYELIVKAYLNQTSVNNIAGLHVMVADMLLIAKGLKSEESPYALPINPDHVLRFISENKEQVDRWLHFLDSTQVYGLTAIKSLNDHYTPKDRFKKVDDPHYVGANIAQLYTMPQFIAIYFSIPGAVYELSYFTYQYEEYAFKNERLAHYFANRNNMAALLFSHFAVGTFKAEEVPVGLFGMGVFNKDSEYYESKPYVPVQS
jgi:hypothetical protein